MLGGHAVPAQCLLLIAVYLAAFIVEQRQLIFGFGISGFGLGANFLYIEISRSGLGARWTRNRWRRHDCFAHDVFRRRAAGDRFFGRVLFRGLFQDAAFEATPVARHALLHLIDRTASGERGRHGDDECDRKKSTWHEVSRNKARLFKRSSPRLVALRNQIPIKTYIESSKSAEVINMRYPSVTIAACLVAASGLAACANQNGTSTAASSSSSVAGTPQTTVLVPPAKTEPTAPQDLRLYFDPGRSQVRPDSRAVLDQAARLFREGDPLVMTVSGQADTTGNPRSNLLLSQERAASVARGLMDRGIPPSRLQLIAKGESEPLVKTADGVAQPENRAVIITWRK